jgi:hypothetical protein
MKPYAEYYSKVVVSLAIAVLAGACAHASTNIAAIPRNVTGSGNGTLDLRMFTFSGSEILNAAGSFNGDNGNNTLPQGGGAEDTHSFAESYVTTAGELKAFYNLNFAPNSINEIVLSLDLNETGAGQVNNTLSLLNVILNPASIQGNPSPSGDVSSAGQAAINQAFTGGNIIASLAQSVNLPVNSQGAGFADYAIFTGINPFSLNDNDVLLFNVSMGLLNDGAEDIFLSGTISGTDILPVPEPATLLPVALLLLPFGASALRSLRKRQLV